MVCRKIAVIVACREQDYAAESTPPVRREIMECIADDSGYRVVPEAPAVTDRVGALAGWRWKGPVTCPACIQPRTPEKHRGVILIGSVRNLDRHELEETGNTG